MNTRIAVILVGLVGGVAVYYFWPVTQVVVSPAVGSSPARMTALDKAVQTAGSVKPVSTASDSLRFKFQNRLDSLASMLSEGRLTWADYLVQVKRLGSVLTGQEIWDAIAHLDEKGSKLSVSLALLAGSSEMDIATTLKIIAARGMFKNETIKTNAELLQFAGKICHELIASGDPQLEGFLEMTGSGESVRRTALRELVKAKGVEAAVAAVMDSKSGYSGGEPFKGVYAITESAKESGWMALETLANAVYSSELSPVAMKPVAEAMAAASPESAFAAISSLPIGDKRSVAMNGFFKVMAQSDPELALSYLPKISNSKHEQINALLALHGTFSVRNMTSLAAECAELLKANGVEPP